MHDVGYNVAYYLALASAALLSVLSICRELTGRLPRSVDRWVQPQGILDHYVGRLAAAALLILLLWLVRIIG